jgi:hypothetical protein
MTESASTAFTEAEHNGHFPERTEVRFPRGFLAVCEAIARRKHTKRSEVIRQLLIAGLEAEGITLTP